MYGWRGKVLRVDLTRGVVREESLDLRVAKDFIGGRGLGIQRLLAEVDPTCDPLGPENVLIMAAGPLTGTKAPTGARYMVMTKSPLTGSITCSNSGGQFPAELKKAGVDMISFHGQAAEPVTLWIDGDKIELRPAAHLWGLSTHDTEAMLQQEAGGGVRVACIGPAGERGVLFASIMNDRDRAAGRSGVGAVMGSKNLKAVVVRGKDEVPLHDTRAFSRTRQEARQTFSRQS